MWIYEIVLIHFVITSGHAWQIYFIFYEVENVFKNILNAFCGGVYASQNFSEVCSFVMNSICVMRAQLSMHELDIIVFCWIILLH